MEIQTGRPRCGLPVSVRAAMNEAVTIMFRVPYVRRNEMVIGLNVNPLRFMHSRGRRPYPMRMDLPCSFFPCKICADLDSQSNGVLNLNIFQGHQETEWKLTNKWTIQAAGKRLAHLHLG